jgi:RimJ/RimL family protein N-acetyltransferase
MPRAGDAASIVDYHNDLEIRRWDTLPEPFTSADADAWLTAAEVGRTTGRRYQFAIEVGGRLIGDLNLRPQGAGLALIGFGLAAGHRGQGMMTRALRLALPWGFKEASLDVVHWRAQVGNWASRRVAWAVGFRVLDTPVPGLLEHQGRRVDGWLATLRRDDPLEPSQPWLEPERIVGRSVVLRAHRGQDVPRIVEACRDPETTHWLSPLPLDYGETQAREHLDKILSEQAHGKAVYWAVADPETDLMLAELGLFIPHPSTRQGEIGYWCHPDARGRGVTTEAVRLAARHGLLPVEEGGLGLVRLLLRASVDNAASQRVAEKAGFTRSGLDREGYRLRDGRWHDDVRFDLLAAELPAVR